jgi:hypothetical protein
MQWVIIFTYMRLKRSENFNATASGQSHRWLETCIEDEVFAHAGREQLTPKRIFTAANELPPLSLGSTAAEPSYFD